MKVLEFYRLINHDEVVYVNLIDNATREEFSSISDDFITGGYKEEYLFGLDIMSVGIEEDSCNINLYVRRRDMNE